MPYEQGELTSDARCKAEPVLLPIQGEGGTGDRIVEETGHIDRGNLKDLRNDGQRASGRRAPKEENARNPVECKEAGNDEEEEPADGSGMKEGGKLSLKDFGGEKRTADLVAADPF